MVPCICCMCCRGRCLDTLICSHSVESGQACSSPCNKPSQGLKPERGAGFVLCMLISCLCLLSSLLHQQASRTVEIAIHMSRADALSCCRLPLCASLPSMALTPSRTLLWPSQQHHQQRQRQQQRQQRSPQRLVRGACGWSLQSSLHAQLQLRQPGPCSSVHAPACSPSRKLLRQLALPYRQLNLQRLQTHMPALTASGPPCHTRCAPCAAHGIQAPAAVQCLLRSCVPSTLLLLLPEIPACLHVMSLSYGPMQGARAGAEQSGLAGSRPAPARSAASRLSSATSIAQQPGRQGSIRRGRSVSPPRYPCCQLADLCQRSCTGCLHGSRLHRFCAWWWSVCIAYALGASNWTVPIA